MFVKARFLIRVAEGTVSVAATALGLDGERSYVYVRSGDGQFARRHVIPSAIQGGRALIQRGIAENEEVLVKGLSLLDSQRGVSLE